MMDKVDLEVNDVVLAMSDGVVDNLWEHEVVENVAESIRKWEFGEVGQVKEDRMGGAGGGMLFVAEELMKAARAIAEDPFAESPFMERAVEEGLAMEGGMIWSIPRILLVYTDSMIRKARRHQCCSCALQTEERMKRQICSSTSEILLILQGSWIENPSIGRRALTVVEELLSSRDLLAPSTVGEALSVLLIFLAFETLSPNEVPPNRPRPNAHQLPLESGSWNFLACVIRYSQ